MKKKVLSGVFALAPLATAGWGVNKSMSNDAGMSDLALSNVEALATGESGNHLPYQSQGYCTMWRIQKMCSSTGAYACQVDC